MTHSILDDIALWVQQHLLALFGPLFEYLFLVNWYVGWTALLALCVTIGYFLPFQWVRAALGFVLLLAGAFVAGGTVMWRHLKQHKAPPPPPPQPREKQWERW